MLELWCNGYARSPYSGDLAANRGSVITQPCNFTVAWKKMGFLCGFCSMFGLDSIMKSTVTCIPSMDPEARWLTLLARGWVSGVTRTSTMASTGVQEKQVQK